MAKKIYFSPSNQTDNRYAVGNTTEAAQCNRITIACVTAAKRCGFEAKTNTNGSIAEKVKESNKWNADVHIPIHTNACNKKVMGTRLFCYSMTGEGRKICEQIMKTLAPITPGKSDAVTSDPTLIEINSTNAKVAYVEVGFHDTRTEAKWIIEHTDEIAEQIVKGLCNHYKRKYVAPNSGKKPSPTVKTLYRIRKAWTNPASQVGAYASLSNAKKEADNHPGYKVYDDKGKCVYTSKTKKSITEVAKDVIRGKYGNDPGRTKKLLAEGYDPKAVQKKVNELL